MSGDDPSMLGAYMLVSNNDKRTWKRYWVALHPVRAVCLYKTHKVSRGSEALNISLISFIESEIDRVEINIPSGL